MGRNRQFLTIPTLVGVALMTLTAVVGCAGDDIDIAQAPPTDPPVDTSTPLNDLAGLRMMSRSEATEQCARLEGTTLSLPQMVDPNWTSSPLGIGVALNANGDLVAFDPSSNVVDGPDRTRRPNVQWYLVAEGDPEPRPVTAAGNAPVAAEASSETPPSAIQISVSNGQVIGCEVVEAWEYPSLFSLE